MTLSITIKNSVLSITGLIIVMLCVIMLTVIIHIVFMLSVMIPNVPEQLCNNFVLLNWLQNGIIKNSQDVQSVTENYNNYRNSQVKFLVETVCCEGYDKWPDNTRIWYKNKFLDTHNAVSDSQVTRSLFLCHWFYFKMWLSLTSILCLVQCLHVRLG